MISQLTGTITHKTSTFAVIQVNGVGYQIFCPTSVLNKLKTQNSKPETIYTQLLFRDPDMILYGFAEPKDRDLFQQLRTVSGVGPKTALAILSQAATNTIIKSIQTADVNFFTQVPGLGKKGAQKIIVELKNKLGSLAELDLAETELETHAELIQALIALGYSPQEAQQAAKQIPLEVTELNDQIKHALKNL